LFAFDQTVNNGALFAGLEGSSIKVRYVNANGKGGRPGIRSLSPPIPGDRGVGLRGCSR
jgi:hypothetical protein